MSSSARGRGGKFNKHKRGGGKHYSRDLQPLNADGEIMGMWDAQPTKTKPIDEESSEEDEDEEEESSDEDESGPAQPQQEMTREQRRAAAKARKAAAIAKQQQKVAAPGDLPTDSEEEEGGDDSDDDDMPANPNHTAKARSQAAKPTPAAAEAADDKGKKKAVDPSQLSRREREALQAQQARERYEKLHAEGKTDQARADLERLRLVREKREADAARKKAEAEEKAEHERAKKEQLERDAKRREMAARKKAPKKGAKGK